MTIKNYANLVVIVADENNSFITQSADIDIKDRIFSKKIYLAINDSKDNWKEITDAEYQILKEQQDKQIKENEDAINEQTESNI